MIDTMRRAETAFDAAELRKRLLHLRAEHGDQNWLTVVSGVVAAGYRRAGLTGAEFGALLRGQCSERDRLLLHLRRRPLMALRRGFDGGSGAIAFVDGVAEISLFVDGQGWRYTEMEDGGPRAFVSRKLPTHLLVTGGLGQPLGRVVGGAVPRCFADAMARVTGIVLERHSWGDVARLDVAARLETLEAMPDDVARRLGVEPQRHLRHVPLLGIYGPEPAFPAASLAPGMAPVAHVHRKRPTLRLVGA